jgi:hypothetical protein
LVVIGIAIAGIGRNTFNIWSLVISKPSKLVVLLLCLAKNAKIKAYKRRSDTPVSPLI